MTRLRWRTAWALALLPIALANLAGALPRPQAPLERGVAVTYESKARTGDDVGPITLRGRLLSLAVERGETPTPLLASGAFRATFRTVVELPARDRMRFRIDGRGQATLFVNDAEVLDGNLRPGKPLETSKDVRLKKGGNDLRLVFDSTAMGDGQVRLFWAGADFGFEPIAPEQLAFDPVEPALLQGELLRRGHRLFAERRCARCHDYDQLRVGESAFRQLDAVGPDLRQVGARTHPAFLAEWLADPRAIRADATMPAFALSEQETRDVAAYFASHAAPVPDPSFDAQQASAGQQRFREFGCIACHVEPGATGPDPVEGERLALAHVGRRWRAAALVAYLQEPAQHFPDVRMPNLRLSPEHSAELAAFLLRDATPASAPKGDPKEGRRLVQKHECHLCHAVPDDIVPGDRVFPRYRSLDAQRGCLDVDPRRRGAPDHGFDDDDRAALRAFLPLAERVPFRSAPIEYADWRLEAERCTACHALDGEPSTWARVVRQLQSTAPLPKEQDPVAQGVPALTWVGAKLQPSWLTEFVTGRQPSPRPWLTARMPTFAAHGAAIAGGLVREHGYGPQDEPLRPADAQMAIHGERLVEQGTGFGCVACHALGKEPAVQVFEREGIELSLARRRLRHEYFTRWLRDPTRLDADSRMPKYADDKGRTALADVLAGDAAQQFEAIWQFLGTLQPR